MAGRFPRYWLLVDKTHAGALVGEHGGDEPVPVAEGEGNFESFEQL